MVKMGGGELAWKVAVAVIRHGTAMALAVLVLGGIRGEENGGSYEEWDGEGWRMAEGVKGSGSSGIWGIREKTIAEGVRGIKEMARGMEWLGIKEVKFGRGTNAWEGQEGIDNFYRLMWRDCGILMWAGECVFLGKMGV
ncbi:unnamed protein product [Calypogeia fissa]